MHLDSTLIFSLHLFLLSLHLFPPFVNTRSTSGMATNVVEEEGKGGGGGDLHGALDEGGVGAAAAARGLRPIAQQRVAAAVDCGPAHVFQINALVRGLQNLLKKAVKGWYNGGTKRYVLKAEYDGKIQRQGALSS